MWGSKREGRDAALDLVAAQLYTKIMQQEPADLHCVSNGDAALLAHYAQMPFSDAHRSCQPGARFKMNGRDFLVYDFQEAKSEPRRNSS